MLSGGSSVNAMAWAHGHKNDWEFYASEADDPAWNYESVLEIYKRIEDWQGAPDPKYRGTGGPVFVQPAPDPNPIAAAMLEGARSVGIPTFESNNGRMMEGAGGASLLDLLVRDGKRRSIFRAYTYAYMDRLNLTVLSHALVTRLLFEGKRATGVECLYGGNTHRIGAGLEVVLSLGAVHTPKVLDEAVAEAEKAVAREKQIPFPQDPIDLEARIARSWRRAHRFEPPGRELRGDGPGFLGLDRPLRSGTRGSAGKGMSAALGLSGVEIGFALGALALTCIAGACFLPTLRKALQEHREEEDRSA
jgi:choline dehydrogenase-like flavoprotein